MRRFRAFRAIQDTIVASAHSRAATIKPVRTGSKGSCAERGTDSFNSNWKVTYHGAVESCAWLFVEDDPYGEGVIWMAGSGSVGGGRLGGSVDASGFGRGRLGG